MNQAQISEQLNAWLDEGFDVHAILNQVMTIRVGEAEVRARNAEWQTNNKYIFGVKTPDECYDEHWKWYCICIVKEDYWNKDRHLEDHHLSGEIHLPKGFGEEMESHFSYAASAERNDVVGILKDVGFRHSQDLQDWMMQHDP